MEENTMKYNYGVTPNFNESTTIKAPQLLSLIERDVKQGKKREIQFLENKLQKLINVTPRKF